LLPERLELADTLRGLARLHLSRNKPPAAETRLRQACEIRRAVIGEQHPGYAEGLTDLAGLHHQTGNFLAADLHYRQALEVLRANPGEDHPDYALAQHGRAAVLHAVGELAEAEKLLEQALRTLQADTADPDPRSLEVRHSLALLHASRSDFLRAEALLKQTVEGYERAVGPDHAALAPVLTDLSRVYEAMGDLAGCGPVLDRIRAINVRAPGEGSLPHAFDLVAASNLARLQGDGERAEAQARRALAVARAVLPDGHPGLVEFLRSLALACQARHNTSQVGLRRSLIPSHFRDARGRRACP
jgi:tetratricopeptide (TPR) repeat protein